MGVKVKGGVKGGVKVWGVEVVVKVGGSRSREGSWLGCQGLGRGQGLGSQGLGQGRGSRSWGQGQGYDRWSQVGVSVGVKVGVSMSGGQCLGEGLGQGDEGQGLGSWG